jgi:Tetratricopeptide repeat
MTTAYHTGHRQSCARAYGSLPYLHISHWPSGGKVTVRVDDQLMKHLWNSLVEVHIGAGGDDRVSHVCEIVIKEYEAAVDKKGSNLMWQYTGWSTYGGDHVFERERKLSESVLWSVLGEAYKANGNIDKAVDAFRKALQIEKDYVWLQRVLCDLGAEQIGDLEGAQISTAP